MRRLLSVLKEERSLAGRIVFEIAQSDYTRMPIPMLDIVRGLSKLGVQFSIDRVTDLTLDIADMERFGVSFVKIDASILRKIQGNRIEWLRFQKLRRQMDGCGISLIAGKIEDHEMLEQLSTMALSYGQGYLFGRPAPPEIYGDNFETSATMGRRA